MINSEVGMQSVAASGLRATARRLRGSVHLRVGDCNQHDLDALYSGCLREKISIGMPL